MYAFKTILALATPLMAVANPLVARTDPCNSGAMQCCQQVQKASAPSVSDLLSLLGIVAAVDALIGLNCNPITVIGLGSTNCDQTTVCCENDEFNGLINVGCTPININL